MPSIIFISKLKYLYFTFLEKRCNFKPIMFNMSIYFTPRLHFSFKKLKSILPFQLQTIFKQRVDDNALDFTAETVSLHREGISSSATSIWSTQALSRMKDYVSCRLKDWTGVPKSYVTSLRSGIWAADPLDPEHVFFPTFQLLQHFKVDTCPWEISKTVKFLKI